jgi:hypothetical protein
MVSCESCSFVVIRSIPLIVQPINFRQPAPLDFDDHAGYVRIFDGMSLKDWDGDPSFWHVENGAIVGVSTTRNIPSAILISFIADLRRKISI